MNDVKKEENRGERKEKSRREKSFRGEKWRWIIFGSPGSTRLRVAAPRRASEDGRDGMWVENVSLRCQAASPRCF